MSEITQFEREAQAQEERTKREQNISILEARLTEAKNIYDVVVENPNERKIVGDEIAKIEKMLKEEKQHYHSAGISKEDTDGIVAGMRF